MSRRIRRVRSQIRRAGGIDLLIAHAPMRDIGDAEDLCHRGFESLRALVDQVGPRWYCHGHVHKNYDFRFRRERDYGATKVINAWTSYIIEVEPAEDQGRHRISKKRIIK